MKASLDKTEVPTALMIVVCAHQSERILETFNQLVKDLIKSIIHTVDEVKDDDVEQFEELLMDRVHKLASFEDANDYLNRSRDTFGRIVSEMQQFRAQKNN